MTFYLVNLDLLFICSAVVVYGSIHTYTQSLLTSERSSEIIKVTAVRYYYYKSNKLTRITPESGFSWHAHTRATHRVAPYAVCAVAQL